MTAPTPPSPGLPDLPGPAPTAVEAAGLADTPDPGAGGGGASGDGVGAAQAGLWTVEDYLATGNDSAGAKKLAGSAVAPLVAMARGYETIHEETFAGAMKRYPMPRRQTLQGRRFADAVARGDLLVMPWFTHDDIELAQRSGRQPKPATVQVRPSRPEVNARGREIKYEFVGGLGTPIGMHPAIPTSWIDSTPVVLLAEGLLKGDSALTGYLLAHGISRDELAWPSPGNSTSDRTSDRAAEIAGARTRLASLMQRIDRNDQVLVLTIGGVDNWKHNPEWRTINLVRRQVWLGVDGDVASNPNVHRATSELWEFVKTKQKAIPLLFAPSVPSSASASPTGSSAGGSAVPVSGATPEHGEANQRSQKIGIDDYLAEHGDWDQLVAMLAAGLPARPAGTQAEFVGQHRISPDGTSLQICKPIPDLRNPEGPPVGGTWEEVLPLGGRIVSVVAHRSPTPGEIATGRLGDGLAAELAAGTVTEEVEIELCWRDPADDDLQHRHVIHGPAEILNYPPDQWARYKADIPAAILRMPDWPPGKKIGEDWLKAMKAHRADEQQTRIRWGTMGWVPVEHGVPVFVIGDQIIGDTLGGPVGGPVGRPVGAHGRVSGGSSGWAGAEIAVGVTETELAGSTRFGVGPDDERDLDDHPDSEPNDQPNDQSYRDQVRRDIERTLDRFITAGAWTDRRVASTLFAAALRPALPLRPRAVIYVWGPPRKGKTYSAAMMMGFWSRNPGDFTDASLPGSANDTPAAMEIAVSRAPIWVVDDLAPSTSRQQSDREQSKIENLVRAVHNGTPRRRSDVNMSSRRVFPPRALVVITAENLLGVGSSNDRTIALPIGWGALAKSRTPTDRLEHLCYRDGAPARVTQALLKFIRMTARQDPDGWPGLYHQMTESLAVAQQAAEQHIKSATVGAGAGTGNPTRHAAMAGDLAVTLMWLYRLAHHVGVRDELKALLLGNKMIDDIYSLVGEHHRTSRNANPGRDLIEAIAGCLYRGRAHVRNALHPAQPPGDDDTAAMLGWDIALDDRSRAKGDTIGWLVEDPKHGPVVYFDQKAAFILAQNEYPTLVRAGQGHQASWAGVIGEGYAVDDLRRTGRDGKLLSTGRRRDKQVAGHVSGIPILLSAILNPAGTDDHPVQLDAA